MIRHPRQQGPPRSDGEDEPGEPATAHGAEDPDAASRSRPEVRGSAGRRPMGSSRLRTEAGCEHTASAVEPWGPDGHALCTARLHRVDPRRRRMTTPPSEQSASDQALIPTVWCVFGGLVLLSVRTLFIGVYLAPARSSCGAGSGPTGSRWTGDTVFGLEAWNDWLLSRGEPVGNAQMITVTGTSSRSFPATGVRRSRAVAQRDLLNAYAALEDATEATARDWARGAAWRIQRDQSKLRQAERQRRGGRHSDRSGTS